MTENNQSRASDSLSYPQFEWSDAEKDVLLNRCRGRIEVLSTLLDEAFLASEDQSGYLVGAYAALQELGERLEDGGFRLAVSTNNITQAEKSLMRDRESRDKARAGRRAANAKK